MAVPGRGTAVRSTVPADDPTARLRATRATRSSSPPDQREATLAVRAGAGTVTAPRGEGAGLATTRAPRRRRLRRPARRRPAGLSLLLLAAAFGWGAVHALSPGPRQGDGRGLPGRHARHAARMRSRSGSTVTVTHTIGVFALGVVTLALSA